ncbi:MAG TPA: hypothetical protein EYP57_05825 [Thermodesulfobacteriaceae bacterium]|nr:hypothetical protein [Thermodesulfobacteriaceae bacterium]
MTGCKWCSVRLSVDSLYKLGQVAPPKTYQVIIERLETEKLDELILKFSREDYSNFPPAVEEIV